VRDYRLRLEGFRGQLEALLPAPEWLRCQEVARQFEADGLTALQALQIASCRYMVGFLPAVHIAAATGAELGAVTTAMSSMRLAMKLPSVMQLLDDYQPHDRWDRLARSGLRSSLVRQAVRLTQAVVAERTTTAAYLAGRRQRSDYYLGLVDALQAKPASSISPFMVLLRALEAL